MEQQSIHSCGAPASWKGFRTVEEYSGFMQDPSRVVRLEWRKVRRQQHKGLTSHSWLEAHLVDGRRLRLELFADTGLTEAVLHVGSSCNRDSVVYENRAAESHEFARPLTAERLRRVARQAAATRLYSVTDWNCHHFVLHVWNAVVIEMLNHTHYPDRVKTGFLWGATESFGKLWVGGATWASRLGLDQRETVPEDTDDGRPHQQTLPFFASLAPGTQDPAGGMWNSLVSRSSSAHDEGRARESLARARSHGSDNQAETALRAECPQAPVQLSAQQEEGSRVSGEIEASLDVLRDREPATRFEGFARVLRQGSVFLLEPGRDLAVLSEASGSDQSRPSSAGSNDGTVASCCWLPNEESYIAKRLAAQIGSKRVVENVLRIIVPDAKWAEPAAAIPPGSMAFASLSSSSMASGAKQQGSVLDECYLVLRTCEELRFAAYLILAPTPSAALGGGVVRPATPFRRLRLLSGDVRTGEEGAFKYTLQDLCDQPTSAETCARDELHSLQIAVTTGDWGFITLL